MPNIIIHGNFDIRSAERENDTKFARRKYTAQFIVCPHARVRSHVHFVVYTQKFDVID